MIAIFAHNVVAESALLPAEFIINGDGIGLLDPTEGQILKVGTCSDRGG